MHSFSLLDLAGAKFLTYVEWDIVTKGRSEVSLKFLEYSNSNEFLVTQDVVEYDNEKMTKRVYDLFFGSQAMKELGIVLDF